MAIAVPYYYMLELPNELDNCPPLCFGAPRLPDKNVDNSPLLLRSASKARPISPIVIDGSSGFSKFGALGA
jgi:hypothetical protein